MTVVVKLGGHALDSLEPSTPVLAHLAEDVRAVSQTGERVVVVHGGGPQIAALLTATGTESSFVDGLRVTDETTMGYVAMALSLVNSHIVAALNANGCMAVGLSGVDASMTTSTALGSTWGRAGSPPVVTPNIIELLLDEGVTPVISPVAIDEEGRLLNCNADTTAGAVAAALEASLLLLSDIDQVRSDPDDPASSLGSLSRADVVHMLAEGTAREGMRPKVQAALDALDGGAPSVVLANGTRPHAFANTMSRTIPLTEITQ